MKNIKHESAVNFHKLMRMRKHVRMEHDSKGSKLTIDYMMHWNKIAHRIDPKYYIVPFFNIRSTTDGRDTRARAYHV